MEEIKLQIWNYLSWLRERGQTFMSPWQESEAAAEDMTLPSPFPPAALAAEELPMPLPAEKSKPVKLVFLSASELLDEERQMVERIAAALGLAQSDFRMECLNELSPASLENLEPTQVYVLLGIESDEGRASHLSSIPHPRAMLQEPALKKSAWEKLQKLKATL